jgi:hypothetical protein
MRKPAPHASRVRAVHPLAGLRVHECDPEFEGE